MLDNEEMWKDILGYDGVYQVSNFGRVRNVVRGNHILCQSVSSGYPHVSLNRDGVQKSFLVHRLVATLFVPNYDNKPEVNHIDGNKLNNNSTNLEWVTPKENQIHSIKIGLKHVGENAPNSKLSQKEVESIRSEYIPNTRGHGCRTLAKKYGVNSGTIWNIVNGRYWRWNLCE